MSERLDRIEVLLADSLQTQADYRQDTDRMIRALAEISARNAGELTELRGIMENFSSNLSLLLEEQRLDRQEFRYGLNLFSERMEVMQSDIREIQSEVRGLQTETRRIWEEIQNHRRDGHGD